MFKMKSISSIFAFKDKLNLVNLFDSKLRKINPAKTIKQNNIQTAQKPI